ncbi:membrane protein [Clostridia bacterium]|nr:membrane protein [Clostridia bacterium]
MTNNNQKDFKTKIGGQALISGIMMKGPDKEAMAVRQKDGDIFLETKDLPPQKWYNKAPFVRGVCNFIGQMKSGYVYMMRSADISGAFDEDEEEDEKEQKQAKESKFLETLMSIGSVLGVLLFLVLFLFIPTWFFSWFKTLFAADITRFRSLCEGILRILIFVGYMWLTAFMKEIRETYEYHGGEHKTIRCYERGLSLTVENVRGCSRFHPRCGTSFIFLILAVSIIFYSVVPINSEMFSATFGVSRFMADFLRVACKIVLAPVLIGISYEIIRIAGRYDNTATRIISAPGIALQRLTTREPNDGQIEVAIKAMEAVIPKVKGSDEW